MSDARLRSLERQTDTPEARARLLVERMRAGWGGMEVPCVPCKGHGATGKQATNVEFLRQGVEGELSIAGAIKAHMLSMHCGSCHGTGRVWLPRGRLELAAYCGDEGARLAVGTETAPWPRGGSLGQDCLLVVGRAVDALPLPSFAGGLSRWGPEVLARAAVAAGWVALEAWQRAEVAAYTDLLGDKWPEPRTVETFLARQSEDYRRRQSAPRRALEAAEAWLACKCARCAERWGLIRVGVGPNTDPGGPGWLPWPGDHLHAGRLAERAEEAARLAGEPAVREAVQRALVAWSLS